MRMQRKIQGDMKVNQLKLGSLLSYIQMGIGIIIGLLYTPVMIRLLGRSEYGLYNTVSSIISMLSVLSLGFNSGYIRFFSKYRLNNDAKAIYRLNGLFLTIFIFIGAVALLSGLVISANLKSVFAQGLNAEEYQTAQVLMVLLSINLAISFPMSVFQNIISAHEHFIFLKLLGIIKTLAGPLVTIPLLLLGFRSIGMVTATLITSLLVDAGYLLYARRKLDVRFFFNNWDKHLFWDIFSFTFFIAINMVVDQINSNIGKFLLGRYLGTTAVAVYSVGFSLYQYYMMFSTAISGVFSPRIYRIVLTTKGNLAEQKKQLTNLFTKVGRIQFLVLALIASGLIFFGKPFIYFWAGKEYNEAYFVAILLALSSSVALIQNIGIEIQRAQNNHRFRSIAYLLMAGINLMLTIVLSPRYGATGAAIGTALSLVIANGLIMNIYYHKKCNLDIILFWKAIISLLRGMVLPVFCGILLNFLIDFSSITAFAMGIAVYTMIYMCSVYFLGMNEYEKNLIKRPLIKVIKRK